MSLEYLVARIAPHIIGNEQFVNVVLSQSGVFKLSFGDKLKRLQALKANREEVYRELETDLTTLNN